MASATNPSSKAQPPPDTTSPSSPNFVYLDRPCLNCGRYGCIPGQMIVDSYNHTFCSPDCGWSYLLRPMEQQAAKTAAANAAARAAMRSAPPSNSSRSRRSSRKHAKSSSSSTCSSASSSRRAPPEKPVVSGSKPPRNARKAKSPAERAAEMCMHSGNAMFEYSMMLHGMK